MTLGETLVSIRHQLENRTQAIPAYQTPANLSSGGVTYEEIRPKLLGILSIGSHEDAVREAYRSLFNRDPDPAGFDYYVGRLRLGFSKLSMLIELAESQEGRGKGVHVLAPELRRKIPQDTDWNTLEQYDGAEFVCILYRAILNTDPDTRSVARWAGLLERGVLSKREIFESLLQTQEAALFRGR